MARIEVYIIAGLLGAALVGGGAIYLINKGEALGTAAVTGAVQSKTIETLDAARNSKEKADEEVRRTPYGNRVDGLR